MSVGILYSKFAICLRFGRLLFANSFSHRAAMLLLLLVSITSCGPSGGGGSDTMSFEGTLINLDGQPLVDVNVTLFETAESSVTDESGQFSLETSRSANTVGFFFGLQGYSNVVRLENVPSGADSAQILFIYDQANDLVGVADVQYGVSGPAADPVASPDDGSGDPIPVATPDLFPTPNQTSAPQPSASATPKPTATPQQGKFDEDGNTSEFGIPGDLKGNISKGKSVYGAYCSSCHSDGSKKGRSYGTIKASLKNQPTMQNINLSGQQIAHITAYLNRHKK